jgi:hypothetical protein
MRFVISTENVFFCPGASVSVRFPRAFRGSVFWTSFSMVKLRLAGCTCLAVAGWLHLAGWSGLAVAGWLAVAGLLELAVFGWLARAKWLWLAGWVGLGWVGLGWAG